MTEDKKRDKDEKRKGKLLVYSISPTGTAKY